MTERTHQLTASWIIRETATRHVVMETWNAALVAKLNTAKYEAVPASTVNRS